MSDALRLVLAHSLARLELVQAELEDAILGAEELTENHAIHVQEALECAAIKLAAEVTTLRLALDATE